MLFMSVTRLLAPSNLFTPLKRTAESLYTLHSLAKGFSLYRRHASYSLKTVETGL